MMTRHDKTLKSAVLLSLAAAAVAHGCKPVGGGAETKSLDNFAGSTAVHECSGLYTDNSKYFTSSRIVGVSTPEQKQALDDSLSAVPFPLKDRFFDGELATAIVLSDDVANVCLGTSMADAFANGAKSVPLLSCHKLANGVATIYLSSAPNHIRRGLVRALAYYFVEVDERVDESLAQADVALIRPFDSAEAKAEKTSIALAFLNDVAASKTYNLSAFKNMLPESVLQAGTAAPDIRRRQKNWAALTGIDAIARDSFSDYVLAEAMDSYYCSAKTRAILARDFKLTSAALGLSTSAGPGLNLSGSPRTAVRRSPSSDLFRGANVASTPARRAKPVFSVPATNQIYNPTTMRPFSSANVAAAKSAAGAGGFVAYNAASKTYTGYPGGGQWVSQGNNVFRWVEPDASKTAAVATGSIARLNPASGTWQYTNPVMYDPVTFKPISADQLAAAKAQYPDSYLAGYITKAADGSGYTGYLGGEYRVDQSNPRKFNWYDSDGNNTGASATLGTNNKWSITSLPAEKLDTSLSSPENEGLTGLGNIGGSSNNTLSIEKDPWNLVGSGSVLSEGAEDFGSVGGLSALPENELLTPVGGASPAEIENEWNEPAAEQPAVEEAEPLPQAGDVGEP